MLDRLLEGMRVLEFGQFMAAPHATLLMARLGAEVIKIDRFPGGDPGRGIGPFTAGGESLWFAQQNRGKKSFVVDIKLPVGCGLTRKLCESADVIIENLRPGTLARLEDSFGILDTLGCTPTDISRLAEPKAIHLGRKQLSHATT